MAKNHDLDEFSDIELDGLDKYMQRNKDAVRAERVQETDRRIAEFDSRKKTLEWAHEALEFCKNEEKYGKDIADISVGIQSLPRIRGEAETIIANEKRRLEEEKETKRINAIRAVEQRIKELDDTIDTLRNAPRSRYWCDDVLDADQQVKEAPREIKLKLKNLPALDRMVREVKSVKEAAKIDDVLAELKRERNKNKRWAQSLLDVEDSLSEDNRQYVTLLSWYKETIAEAKRVYHNDEIKIVSDFVHAIESTNGARIDFDQYNRAKEVLGRISYSMSEFISDFNPRWKKIEDWVRDARFRQAEEEKRAREQKEAAEREEKRRRAEAERKRQAEEERRKKEAAERERKEKERRAAEERAKRLREKRRKTVTAVVLTGILVACIIGALLGIIASEKAKPWCIGLIIGSAYAWFWNVMRLKTDWNYAGWCLAGDIIITLICAFICFNKDMSKGYACMLSLGMLVSSIGLLIQNWKDSGSYLGDFEYITHFFYIIFSGILFSCALGAIWGKMAGAIIIGLGTSITFVVMTTLAITSLHFERGMGGGFLAMQILMGLTSLVFLFLSKNYTICAMFLSAGVLLSGIIYKINDEDEDTLYGGLTVGGIVGVIATLVFFFAYPHSWNELKIEDGVLLAYRGEEEVFVIPEEVTQIGDKAFKYRGPQNNLKEIVFHDNVISIGKKAFKNCDKLEVVDLPNSLTGLQEQAFAKCDNLKEVSFPSSLAVIGKSAFTNCDSLTKLNFAGIGDFGEMVNDSLGIWMGGLREIQAYAFSRCDALQEVYLPESVERVYEYAFERCTNLTTFYFGSNIEALGIGLFANGAHMDIIYNGTEYEWDNIDRLGSILFKWKYCIKGYNITFLKDW